MSAHPSNPQQTTTTRRRTLSSGSDDPLPGAPGEPEGGDGELGDDEESLIVRDSADEDENLVAVLVGVVRVLHDSRDGKRRSVRLGVKQALEDDLVELRVGSSGKEAVKLRGGNGSKRGDKCQLTQSLEAKGGGEKARTHLHEQEEVRVLRLGSLPGTLPDVLVRNVDSLQEPSTTSVSFPPGTRQSSLLMVGGVVERREEGGLLEYPAPDGSI